MRNLFKIITPYVGTAFLILILLMGQAYCDMNLPQYTQDLIDTGIQNRGIEHIVPYSIQPQEFYTVREYMTEEQKEMWDDAYGVTSSSQGSVADPGAKCFDLAVTDKDELAKLDDELLLPIIARYQTRDIPPQKLLQMMEQYKEGGKAGASDMSEMEKIRETVGDDTLKAMGIAYAGWCSENAGIDVDEIQREYLWSCGGRMAVMSMLMLMFTVMVSFLASRVGANIGRDLRGRLFRNVISFADAEMDTFSTSSLITRATNDIQQIQMTSTIILRMFLYAPCICVWALYKVYQTHAHMNFIIVSGTACLLALLGLLLVLAMPKFRIMQKLIDGLNSVSREILTGIQVIRAFGREKTEEKRFNDANTKLYRTQLFVNRVMTLMSPVMMIIMYGLTIWITWTASHRIDAGTLQVGEMTAFITYAMMLVSSFLMIAGMSIFLPRAGVAADRIMEVLNTETSITDKEEAEDITGKVRGSVRFRNVSFRYPDAEEDVLTGIDFEARPGETTAIIGSTGCGKSTLVDLIPRFFDVTEGSVEIDGRDVRDVTLASLRDAIGYVPQKGMLFSGTIGSNIRFGAPNATDEDVAEVARIAQAEDFIAEKEDGFDSFIAQSGSNVSGGQKQRISIARALAKKPPILIFDDSFSALDMKTDAALRKELAESAADTTKIIVAQRVGTILHAEQIIVLDDGAVVGKGTHEQLMKNCDIYREIAESQMSADELEGLN